ncbi:hypothetical protein A3D00_02105 [Candidatus Woesebacteria bacterium RIFCSPHIGHO2_02_FULL_38_9]|nr:MAG: hypothetical protein A3D00_02105 [Candidatus Woesebacteria bacterium RIFCSPHIGHO2_02_FULL_38_9]OGM57827.1 MAG: hypothetical protein A3A50_02325 [Candidatus Woesebacteria bacterium RIFCSPLOWO2_01_FULL_38_20]
MKNKILSSKNFAKNLIKHPLFSGSLVMILGSNFTNFLAYIYHLVVGRILGPSAYGELTSVITLLAMFSVTFSFLGMVIVKFVSSGEKEQLGSILSWFKRISLIFGSLICVILIFLSLPLANFLHIGGNITILIGPILFIFFLGFVYKSFLQGVLRFGRVVMVGNFEFVIRFGIGLLLIFLGFSVFGAVVGILGGSILSLLLSIYFLRDLKITKNNYKFGAGLKVVKYSIPVLLASLASNSFFSSDVLLVKHYFNPHEAGIYASLSTLGKIIFYGAAPVSAVMFPMISRRQAEGKGFKKIFYLSLLLTILISLGVLFVYLIFPEIAVSVLFGSKYLEAAQYIFWYGLFMAVYALASLIISFHLSLGNTKIVFVFLFFALFQVLGILIYHGSTFAVIKVSIVSVTLLLVSLLLFFRNEKNKAGSLS